MYIQHRLVQGEICRYLKIPGSRHFFRKVGLNLSEVMPEIANKSGRGSNLNRTWTTQNHIRWEGVYFQYTAIVIK